MKINVLLSLLILMYSNFFSQTNTCKLHLYIVDENGIGLPSSFVKIHQGKKTFEYKTNLEGCLQIENIQCRKNKIEVNSIGYYRIKCIKIKLKESNEYYKIEMKPIENLNTPSIEWKGGWSIIELPGDSIKCIRSR